jgi:hypothetical protein
MNYVIIRAGPLSREAMRTFSLQEKVRMSQGRVSRTNLGMGLADLAASQAAIFVFKESLPGGMANTRHIESGVTGGDSLYDVGI